MKKTYIIIAVVVVVLWAGFMGYRHLKKKEGNQAHHADTYNRILETAKKSPRAGLTEMGMALNRYYKDNKSYPDRLVELYPKYIGNRAFIVEINWDYEAGENDFSLSKTVVYNNRELMASVDKSLRPAMETGTAVARRPEPVRRRVARRAEQEEAKEEEPVSIAELEIVDEIKMTGTETNVVAAAAGADIAAARDATDSKEITVQREMSRIVAQVGPEIVSEEKTDFVSRSLERYLVWKNSEGFIGVSNIQYPEADNMYVAIYDTWYNVKRRKSEIGAGDLPETLPVPEARAQKGVERLALGLSRNYLVWKDENGVIGVGNTQYPDAGRLTIASQEKWGALERAPLPETPVAGKPETKQEPVDADKLAAGLSSHYLVWKDENGVIGVGNTQYPDAERLTIASQEKWGALERAPLPETPVAEKPETKQEPVDADKLGADLSSHYLVWKDENGVIGVGNVQFPDRERLEIASMEKWRTLDKEPPPAGQTGSGQKADMPEGESGALAVGVSSHYLVWKDKNGVIGFGNVEYPDRAQVSYVHSEQSWEKIVN